MKIIALYQVNPRNKKTFNGTLPGIIIESVPANMLITPRSS